MLILFTSHIGKNVSRVRVFFAQSFREIGVQQHLNYVALGVKQPPFPGGLVSNGSINGTPEFAYGLTDWWEVGLYLPFAIQDQQFLSDSFKLRTLFEGIRQE